ncbi:heavy-metal-associated domain-containing protein [bacterium]|nr:heavy-metal-associated domain-containing protein [bacterium]
MFRDKLIVLALTLLLMPVSPVLAQVEEVVLRVDGLACPFCAYGVEKKLNSLAGPESFDVLINEGKVMILEWDPDVPLSFELIDEAVDEAGFTLRGVKGSFVGTLDRDDESFFLVMPAPIDQRFYLHDSILDSETLSWQLEPGDHALEGTIDAYSEATLAQLEDLFAGQDTVKVFGLVHAHDDADRQLTLGIEELEVVTTDP